MSNISINRLKKLEEFSWVGTGKTLFWVDQKEKITKNKIDDLRTLIYQAII
tara:strand:+ start:1145 stop:1297 length:153 start_codon:yes stop_codon:yes gene_type:complete